MKDIFAEIGFGNETFLSTELEQDEYEYRIKGFILPEKIKGIYLRFYIGKRNIIFSSRNGLVIKRKEKPKFKILFGVYGKSLKVKTTKYGIIAIHGGNIEPGTAEIARAIAGNNFPLYINEKGPHITSTKFRNNEVQKILDTCEIIISIHGVHGFNSSFIMLGGLSSNLIAKISENFIKNGFDIKIPPYNVNGDNPKNICNLGVSKKGIQLEISRKLRDELVNDKNLLYLFSQSIRNVL